MRYQDRTKVDASVMILLATLSGTTSMLLALSWAITHKTSAISSKAAIAWILFFAFLGVGLLGVSLRGIIPTPISIIAGNCILFIGLGLCGFAVSQTLAQKGRLAPIAIAPLIWLIACGIPDFYDIYYIRALVSNLIVAALIANISYNYRIYSDKSLYFPKPIVLLTIVYALLHVAFSIALFFTKEVTLKSAMASPVFIAFYFTSTILFCIFMALSLAIILEIELQNYRRRAEQDDLTGLLNRTAFLNQINQNLSPTDVSKTYAFAMIDIDHFKQINDRYGHAFGDMALVKFGRTCQTSLPPTAISGRLGGEEFGIFLPDCSPEGALAWVKALQTGYADDMTSANSDDVSITFSTGLIIADQKTTDIKDAMSLADKELYAAKTAGRNRINHLDTSSRSAQQAANNHSTALAVGSRPSATL